ncbi:flagellar hook-length control protein FliK [Clostridium sp. AM27-31LB]|uniref:flagellar hook-length control protein FliK n=2 Tax=Clostridia TaxID=186801 RepID=UPI0015FB506A|nr:flagellar hook-length control protein FliK [Clostridium sp. AM27-31LB]
MAEIKSLMMDSLSKVQSNNQVQMKKDKNANDFANCLSASKNGNTANTKNSVSDNQKSSNLKVAKSNTVNAKNTDDNISELNANTSAKADLKSVENVANEITNEVRDILGVDDETLANAMTALGFSALDLLDTSNLAKLVLTINGSSEFTDLLTDENMMNQLNSLIDVVENINWEELTGMSKEDFATVLANSTQQGDIEHENLMTTVSDGETFSVIQEDASDRQVNVQTDVSDNITDVSDNITDVSDNITDVSDNITDAKQDVTVVVEKNQSEAEQGSAQTDSDAGKNMSEEIAESTLSDDDAVSSRQTNVQNNFIQNMEQAAANVEQTQSARPDTVRMQQMVDIVNQVVEKIKVSLGTESTSMEMQLNPEHLGKVLLNVSSKNGMMTAVFSVQSEEAKAALESQMFTLRENLELRELKVDAVEVNVSDFDFSRSDQAMDGGQSKADDGNGKQMKFDFGDDSSDESAISNEEKEAVRKQVMRDNGSQIDFTA